LAKLLHDWQFSKQIGGFFLENSYKAATFNGYTITAPAHATTVLHIKDGKWVED
jgi:hypothetical protein